MKVALRLQAMSRSTIYAVLVALLMLADSLCAHILRVPAEFPTIQTALDSVEHGDTVLVALGVYPEALQAPVVPFVLKGDVLPDTGDYPRPIIDPTALPGSDSLCCLTLPLGAASDIEDIRFRNGPAMFPRYNGAVGGVRLECGAATFRHCVFDSVFRGLYATSAGVCSLRLDGCQFLKVIFPTYGFPTQLYVDANDCLFSGQGWAHVTAYAGCNLRRCRFGQNWNGPMIWTMRDVSITDCQFGPPLPGDSLELYAAVILRAASGTVQDNLFTGLQLGQGFIFVECACNDSTHLLIHRNRFVNSGVETPHAEGSTEINVICQMNYEGGCHTEIDSNLFENNSGSDRTYRCLAMGVESSGGRANGNRFHHITADTVNHPFPQPIVYVGNGSVVRLDRNRFDSTGLALWDDRRTITDSLDAQDNWWNSPSGPYHQFFNPQGLGDTVIGNDVSISPWCLDTACADLSAAEIRPIIPPFSYALTAYPNPFNNTAILRLEVPQAEIVRVELFDVLGRRVKELWSGIVADRKEIAVDGSALASGVYFVRVMDTIWNRPLVSTKIVRLK
jgi:hypothetical protein